MWLNNSNHVPGCFVQLDEHTVVQLSQSQKLQNLLWLWSELIDTKNKKMNGTKKLECELTIKDGKIVYDLNGLASLKWDE